MDAAGQPVPLGRQRLRGLAAGLTPAPEADRRTLLRRVTFALTGLPPAPEEVEAFVADRSPDAYEKLVDRLVASPHSGGGESRRYSRTSRSVPPGT